MQNNNAASPTANIRLAITLALSIILPLATACHIVHKPVEVEKLLTPLSEANTTQLISLVRSQAGARSIHGKVDIQFEDTSFATSGIAEKYRTADGTITLQRPGKIYLEVQAPLIASDVARMTSDGEHFQIAILNGDEKYKRFVRGTNGAVYSRLVESGGTTGGTSKDPKSKHNQEAQTVSALSSLRPQHITDAMLIRPIEERAASGLLYAQTEFFQEEQDPNPPSTKRVVRGYYLLDELRPMGDGAARLLRRFWFDRVGGIRLARLQVFDDNGALVADVSYSQVKSFGESGSVQMPSRINLTRLQDRYSITITYQSPETVKLDQDYPPDAFVLENHWQLKEVDLDLQKRRTPQP